MIKVMIKGLRILEMVSTHGGQPVRLSELAGQLQEKPSTVAGIVKTLTEAGYLQKDPVRGYRLGIMATTLTHSDLYRRELLVAAHQHITASALKHQLYLSLSVLRNHVRHTIMEISDRGEVIMQASPNAAVMNSSTGLILLSYEPGHKQDEILEYYGLPRRFASYDDFRRYLQEIKQKRFVVLSRPDNRVAIAVPVWHKAQVVAGLGAFLTSGQQEKWQTGQIVALLSDLSGRITADLEKDDAESR
ncbi:MAG: helix-turn-helix domain-containing protein [Ruminococcaceae bacterium]|nr:helix-turn-helix domain-containing protein [Oscillospiraceae bacterium]